MKKVLIGALLAVSFGAIQVWSEEAATVAATNVTPPAEKVVKPPKPPRPVVPMETLTLAGKLAKEEVTRKAKDGTESTRTVYVLKMDDGTSVMLHPSKPAKGQAAQAAINYDNYLDKQVKVVGPGVKSEKNGKKSIMIRTVVSMEEVAAAPVTDAPAVPATPPPAVAAPAVPPMPTEPTDKK